jgi:hypothetical protein
MANIPKVRPTKKAYPFDFADRARDRDHSPDIATDGRLFRKGQEIVPMFLDTAPRKGSKRPKEFMRDRAAPLDGKFRA